MKCISQFIDANIKTYYLFTVNTNTQKMIYKIYLKERLYIHGIVYTHTHKQMK